MARETTYTYARDNLAEILRRVEEDRDLILIRRRGHEDVALLPASELTSLLETAHLLRSPVNARRLLRALHRALDGRVAPSSTEELRRELGLSKAAAREAATR